jgi:hypothetical protein
MDANSIQLSQQKMPPQKYQNNYKILLILHRLVWKEPPSFYQHHSHLPRGATQLSNSYGQSQTMMKVHIHVGFLK